jgi:hypothetical protein
LADDRDVLLEMFKHYINQGLYYQTQRTATANILLILAGATIGFITVDDTKLEEGPDAVAAFFLIVLGLFGFLWSIKYHERYAYYLNRARGYRDELKNRSYPNIDIETINSAAKAETKDAHPFLYPLRVWWLWAVLYVLITGVGVVILVVIWTLPMLVLLGLIIVGAIWRPDLRNRISRYYEKSELHKAIVKWRRVWGDQGSR